MTRKRKNNDIRLSVTGDLDGMTVGKLREMLDGVSDETVIEIDEEEWPNFESGTADIYLNLVIRKDCSKASAIVNQSR